MLNHLKDDVKAWFANAVLAIGAPLGLGESASARKVIIFENEIISISYSADIRGHQGRIGTYICLYIYEFIHVCICIYVFIYRDLYVYIYIYIRTRTYICVHTYIHI
jgi:hypothetical protein